MNFLRSSLSKFYQFLDSNTIKPRFMDIISLYEKLESRNKLVLGKNKMDLNFYFNQNYRQFERTLVD